MYAVEPLRRNFQLLNANVALNGLTNVHTFHAAAVAPAQAGQAAGEGEGGDGASAWMDLGRGDGVLDGAMFSASGRESRVKAVQGYDEAVRLITLDAGLRPPPARVHFLKADVEGGELGVLRGAARLLARDRPVLYLENNVVSHDVGADGVPRGLALVRYARALGYRLFWDRFETRLARALGIGYVESNMLCVPREWWRDDAGVAGDGEAAAAEAARRRRALESLARFPPVTEV